MNPMNSKIAGLPATFLAVLALTDATPAQSGKQRAPAVMSPEVKAFPHVTFRVHAPKAESVSLSCGDIQGDPGVRALKKGDDGVWELTIGPIDPGTYRYVFNVDGVPTVDPRNQAVSESNGNVWSVVHVPGLEFMDRKDVPHGAVAQVYYRSSALGKDRRMHVYTPPGYEAGAEKYPVFYLLHGSGDSDDSWISVGRANFILDNLIAAKKAKPMIVVMPSGHTGPFSSAPRRERQKVGDSVTGTPKEPSKDGDKGSPKERGTRTPMEPSKDGGKGTPKDTRPSGDARFEDDFLKDILPYIETNYRVLTDRPNRAIAGLSMGGAQTINVTMLRPKDFGYVGVFSAALGFGKAAAWENEHKEVLCDPAAKDGLKLMWFATGSQDFLLNRTKETVDVFKWNGFNPVFKETTGGHTWINWHFYLYEFAPQLFR